MNRLHLLAVALFGVAVNGLATPFLRGIPAGRDEVLDLQSFIRREEQFIPPNP